MDRLENLHLGPYVDAQRLLTSKRRPMREVDILTADGSCSVDQQNRFMQLFGKAAPEFRLHAAPGLLAGRRAGEPRSAVSRAGNAIDSGAAAPLLARLVERSHQPV